MKILLWACAELQRAVGKNRAGENVRKCAGLKLPYYAPNSLRGGASSFAKASEDMSKGSRPTVLLAPRICGPHAGRGGWRGRRREGFSKNR